MSVQTEIRDPDWIMDWSPDAQERGKPAREIIFEDDRALAMLLINDVIFLNDHWWEDEWPDRAKKVTSLNVNCNDVFAWGCADAEEMPHAELENLYRMWRKDPDWGPAVWCMIQRNQMPQKPVEDRIRAAGIWDLDKLKLGDNTMEADVSAFLASLRPVIDTSALSSDERAPLSTMETEK